VASLNDTHIALRWQYTIPRYNPSVEVLGASVPSSFLPDRKQPEWSFIADHIRLKKHVPPPGNRHNTTRPDVNILQRLKKVPAKFVCVQRPPDDIDETVKREAYKPGAKYHIPGTLAGNNNPLSRMAQRAVGRVYVYHPRENEEEDTPTEREERMRIWRKAVRAEFTSLGSAPQRLPPGALGGAR